MLQSNKSQLKLKWLPFYDRIYLNINFSIFSSFKPSKSTHVQFKSGMVVDIVIGYKNKKNLRTSLLS